MMLPLYNLQHAIRIGRKKLSRRVLHLRMCGRPESEQLTAERELRGAEQYKTLRDADVVFVSFGKSGRTWLRVMISEVFRVKYDLPEGVVLNYNNLHSMNKAIPRTFFTHDNYIKDYTGDFTSKAPFYDKPVVLLVRDPRDVAVSQFYQWQHRMKPNKVVLNNYPPRDQEISLFDFVMSERGGGMAEVIDYMNLWAREVENMQRFHLVRYEDLRATPNEELRRILDFLKIDATDEQVAEAVDYSSFDKMKKRESQDQGLLSSGRLKPGDKDNPDSYKVRRAKVGGYRDYFSDEEIEAIDAKLQASLAPMYNYS